MKVKKQRKKVLVVGAGAGGLSSAVLLQNAGFSVTVIEKNAFAGGKLSCETVDGFTFDSGPSILTLPSVLRELFKLTGKNLEDYLTLVPLDPQWRCFYRDGGHIDLRAGEDAMAEEVGRVSPKDVDGFRKLSLKARQLYRISEDNFFFRDLSNVVDVIRDGDARPLDALKLMWAIEPHKSYSSLIERYIKNPQLRQAFEHLPQYVGSSPFLSPAILGCLLHVQFEKGCWYPMGGMNKISEALAKRFQELGGELVTSCPVQRVYQDGRSIRGVESEDGRLWTADEYVFNMDVNSLNEKMGLKTAPEKDLACSGVTVFLGLKKKVQPGFLAHHNFFFSKSHEAEFKDLYERRVPHNDPTVYVCAPSLTDPSVAPEGKENLFLLIHGPTVNSKTDWDSKLDSYVALCEQKLADMGLNISDYGVEVRQSRSPKGIGERWGTFKGNIYGHSSHGLLAGGFKPGNASRRFSNMQLAGGTVNPGAGVPMSVMSGMIAGSNLIQKRESLVDLRL